MLHAYRAAMSMRLVVVLFAMDVDIGALGCKI